MDAVNRLEDFLRDKYYTELAKSSMEEQAAVIDFSDLNRSDPLLADQLLEMPEIILKNLNEAAHNILDEKTNVRIKNLPASREIRIRNLRSKHIGKLMQIDTIIRAASEVKPQIYEAIYQCPTCSTNIVMPQETNLLQKPWMCECGYRGDFTLIEKKMYDIRWLVGVEPFELTTGERPGEISILLKEDLTTPRMQKKTDPGNKIKIVGILKELPKRIKGKLSTKMDTYIDAVNVLPSEIEFEELDISEEDERRIKEFASDPGIYEKLKESIAPGIYGFDEIKEALVFQLFGGISHKLPDNPRIRGNIHILITGDPGCLVGDERIVLGNGAISKMQDIGKEHLQKIDVSILTGEGGKKRDKASVFHIYKNQPILEVITESGKSIKGTYNHPLMCISNDNGRLVRKWNRLDEMKIGDKLAVVTSIPCTITKHLETGFTSAARKYGPKFKGKLPKYVDENLASLMGYVLGDGWVDKYEVGFVVAEPEIDILDKLANISETLFLIKPSIKTRKLKDSITDGRPIKRKIPLVYATINSKDIANSLNFLRTKRVPELILRSGNKVVSSFLRWLYEADGSVFDKGRGNRSINLKSSKIELLRDVQILLLRFAIHSRVVGDNLMIRRGESMLKFAKHIGFVSEKKRTKLAQLAKSAEDFKRFKSQRTEKIVKIIKHPPENVYDIEVPRSHRFIANSVISHNTGKSVLLKLVSSVVPRGRYVSGSGVTGAGLTATVVKNEAIGSWVLEAGALILCNKGLIAIDEFDKMSRDDQIAMHEATSIETVSIAKASIVATLPAQTAVLAAANPKFGRFDIARSIIEQIDIPETLLSRFDLKFALMDKPDKTVDEKLAEHIIISRRQPERIEPIISTGFLRKYIAYAKQINSLELTDEAAQLLKDFYVDMRNRYATSETSVVSITLRQYEALLRLAEASAKIRLDNKILIEDANRAIKLMKFSLTQLGYDIETGQIDIDKLESGITASRRKKISGIINIIATLGKETGKEVAIEDVMAEAESQGITNAEDIIEELKRQGTIFEPRAGFVRKL